MKNRFIRALPILIGGVVIFSGCAMGRSSENLSPINDLDTVESSLTENNSKNDEYFSDRDISGEIDYQNAVEVTLDEHNISVDSDGVSISGTSITITKEGCYIFSGTINDGNIIVNTSKEQKVQIVLDGVSITSKTFAPIYVVQADKVFVTLTEGTINSLTNGGSFVAIDDNNVDAVIYSKDDITLNGTGTLKITSPAGEGITGKDEVTITGGNYYINSAQTAIRANDSVAIAGGTFNITTDKDGIKAKKSDDDSIGNIYIAGGFYTIDAKDDGIHATTTLLIDGGTYNITAAEGLEATVVTINAGNISIEASDDGINAARKSSLYSPKIEINGGDITVVMGNGDTDGVDANGDIIINGGTINVTANSAFDYDGEGKINGGKVIVNGEEITTLQNQMMGGHGGMKGQKGSMNEPIDGIKEPYGGKRGHMDGMIEPKDGMTEPKDGMKGPADAPNELWKGKGAADTQDM